VCQQELILFSFHCILKGTGKWIAALCHIVFLCLSTQSAELSKLRGEVGALRKENDELQGELEAQKAQVN